MPSTDNTGPFELHTDGPDSPEYTKQVARHLAEAVRTLNHATLSHRIAGSLHQPADGDYVLVEVAVAIERLPQLLEQIRGWYDNELAVGGLEVKYGQFERDTSGAVLAIGKDLVAASNHISRAYEALNRARQVTATIGAPYDPAEDPDA